MLEVTIDEGADLVTVQLAAGAVSSEADVDELFRVASPDGHE